MDKPFIAPDLHYRGEVPGGGAGNRTRVEGFAGARMAFIGVRCDAKLQVNGHRCPPPFTYFQGCRAIYAP